MGKTYKVYYGNPSDIVQDSNKLSPAPLLSITQQPNYADEFIIGYTYNVTLTGYITSVDNGNKPTNTINDILDRIEDVRNILNKNGATLRILNVDDQLVLEARGSKINSFTFDRSENGWINYAQYSAEIEFKEIDFADCEGGDISNCTDVVPQTYASGLVDITKYKVRSFSDSWEVTLNENMYNNAYNPTSQYAISNQHIQVKYTIEAEGFNHYQVDGSTMPAWEQAKNFCQDKLYDQVKNGLISNILEQRTDGTTSCSPDPDSTIDNLFFIKDDDNGNINLNNTYAIYNETVTCTTSESDGTFSLEYNALVKKTNFAGDFPNASHVLHTFTLEKSVSDSNSNREITLNVNGNIQGLMLGGLITNPVPLSLPQQGKLMLSLGTQHTKYDRARLAYEEITNGSDLSPEFKDALGINFAILEIDACDDYPKSNQLTSGNNFSEGVITYSSSFSSRSACLQNSYYTDITIDQKDPVELTAEIIVPGRTQGPVIQKLNVTSPRSVTISMNGVVSPDACKDYDTYMNAICAGQDFILDKGANILPSETIANAVITQNTENFNQIDGSFSVTRTYTYYDLQG